MQTVQKSLLQLELFPVENSYACVLNAFSTCVHEANVNIMIYAIKLILKESVFSCELSFCVLRGQHHVNAVILNK